MWVCVRHASCSAHDMRSLLTLFGSSSIILALLTGACAGDPEPVPVGDSSDVTSDWWTGERAKRQAALVDYLTEHRAELESFVDAELRTMTAVWMGMSTVRAEMDARQIELIGDKHIAESMQQWLGLSPFAKEKSRLPARPGARPQA